MKQLQINDAEVLDALRAKSQVEVTDASGRVIGRLDFKAMTFPELGMTDEELERREKDPNAKWIPAAEVMTRLRSRLSGGGNV